MVGVVHLQEHLGLRSRQCRCGGKHEHKPCAVVVRKCMRSWLGRNINMLYLANTNTPPLTSISLVCSKWWM